MKPVFAKNVTQFLQKLDAMYDNGIDFPNQSDNSSRNIGDFNSLVSHFKSLRLSGKPKISINISTESYHLICYSANLFQGKYVQCFIPYTQKEFKNLRVLNIDS